MFEHFIIAQDAVYTAVRAELRAGRKASHWMWFVFPQLRALGRSPTAQFYGLGGVEEARAYLDHDVLGLRLRECTGLVLAIHDRTAHDIFGSPDDLKFRSSMTLFNCASPDETLFQTALDRYYGGAPDERTLALLSAGG